MLPDKCFVSFCILLHVYFSIISPTWWNCTSYIHKLHHVSSIHCYPITNVTIKQVVSFIFSCLNYCNSLLAGLLVDATFHDVQCTQNSAIHLVLQAQKTDHVTPLLHFFTGHPSPTVSLTNWTIFDINVSIIISITIILKISDKGTNQPLNIKWKLAFAQGSVSYF